MSDDLSVPNTTAKSMFNLMKALATGPKTRDQIRIYLGLGKVPSHNIGGAIKLGFIEECDDHKFKLCKDYEKISWYDGHHPEVKKSFEKALNNFRPFKSFIEIIKVHGGEINKEKIGNYLKADLNIELKPSSEYQYIGKLVNWGQFSGIIENTNGTIKLHPKYMPHSSIESGNDMDNKEFFNKYLYDKFCENDLNEICKNLEDNENDLNGKRIGDKFENIIYSYMQLLGFSTRKTTGQKEKNTGLSYTSKDGGGDLGLFVHLPIYYRGQKYNGISIACELKAKKSGAPKKSVDQVRTFSAQIQKLFPNYINFKTVISQSIGYEPIHARKNADPDIVHIPFNVIKNLVEIQKNHFNENKELITPLNVVNILDYAITSGNLELTTEYVKEILNSNE